MCGTEEFAAMINPPQASILAVGAARQEPVVVNGRLKVATLLRLTFSVDHRPVDGVREVEACPDHPARAPFPHPGVTSAGSGARSTPTDGDKIAEP
jgi:hypothetical protein